MRKNIDILSAIFYIFALIFLFSIVILAMVNNNPGLVDSKSNLIIARNISRGEGFVNNIVIQHFVVQSLPNPEVIRHPGVPYLLGGLFKIFGVNYAIPVLVNGLTVLITAFMLRAVISLLYGRMMANIAGLLMLLSANYILISILNNNLLVLFTVLLFYIAVLYMLGKITQWQLALIGGVIAGLGFNIKYTFILSAFPVILYLLIFYKRSKDLNIRSLIGNILLFLIVFMLFFLPILVRDIREFGTILYSPLPKCRLADRYSDEGFSAWRWVHYYGSATMSEMIEIFGLKKIIIKEMLIWIKAFVKIIVMNPFISVIIIYSWFRKKVTIPSELRVILLLCAFEPLFSALYWRPDTRFMFPLYPLLIILITSVLNNYRNNNEREFISPGKSAEKSKKSKRLVLIMLILAIAYNSITTLLLFNNSYKEATKRHPEWVEEARALPEKSVILTNDPWTVGWYSEKYAVICPVGEREGLEQVLDIYKPQYYLDTGEGYQKRRPPFRDEELMLIAGGENQHPPWALYKIKEQD